MTILLTGSAGKTASALADALTPSHKVIVASRRPAANTEYPIVQFDWLDNKTWQNVLSHPIIKDSPISGVYLVLPDLPEARTNAIPFVRMCMNHGVRRFVLLSAWENPEGGALLGGVHADLKALGQKDGIEWAVLRPHFFMENFTEPYHLDTIKNENRIYSGAGEGQKPFIAARDIAAVARRALIDSKSLDTDLVLTGPESLSYTDIANTLTMVLKRKIEHVSLPQKEFEEKLAEFGLTAEMAAYMPHLDARVSQGYGKEVFPGVQQVTGERGQTFRDFAEANREKWL